MPIAQLAIGASGDGVTDDTLALQAIFDDIPSGASVDLGTGTYVVSATLDGTALSNVKLFGRATIRARENTDFQYLLDISNTVGVTLDGLTFDASKSTRGNAVGSLSCVKADVTTNCRMTRCVFKNSLGPVRVPAASAVAVSVSGGCRGLRVERCAFIGCGISAIERPSDGIFVRGDDCVIANCLAERVTDHGFVLEGCNNSTIVDCAGIDCTAVAGMSNDTDSDIEGNAIVRIQGICNYFGSFGGVVGAYAFAAGKLRRCRIEGINLAASAGAQGGGSAMYFFGAFEDLQVSNVGIDFGSAVRVMTHGIVLDGASGVVLDDCRIRVDPNACCVRLIRDSTEVLIENSRLENGLFGVYADGTSQFSERRNVFANCHSTVGLGESAKQV